MQRVTPLALKARSNGDILCSQSWFNVYGVNGKVLKLRYSLGD